MHPTAPSGGETGPHGVRPISVTVSGSFRRSMAAVQDAVRELLDEGAVVLSPADPRIVDRFGDFVYVASDRVRRIRTVQSRHLAAIEASDFVWLIAEDGYLGLSAAMEIGYAAAQDVPVYSTCVPDDLTLRQWITVVPSIASALDRHRTCVDGANAVSSVLLVPEHGLQTVHDDLVIAERGLVGTPSPEETASAENALRRARSRLRLP